MAETPSAVAAQLMQRLSSATLDAIYADIHSSFSSPTTEPPSITAPAVAYEDGYQSPFAVSPTTIHNLPIEVLLNIFTLLDGPTVMRASGVCRAWRTHAHDHYVWRHIELGSGHVRPDSKPEKLSEALMVWAGAPSVRDALVGVLRPHHAAHGRALIRTLGANTRNDHVRQWTLEELGNVKEAESAAAAVSEGTGLLLHLLDQAADPVKELSLAQLLQSLTTNATVASYQPLVKTTLVLTPEDARAAVRALERNTQDSAAFVEALGTALANMHYITHLGEDRVTPAHFRAAGLNGAVVAAMRRWPENAGVQRALCLMLRNTCAERNDVCTQALKEADGLSVLVTALSLHANQSLISTHALHGLNNLVMGGELTSLVEVPGVVELVCGFVGESPDVTLTILSRLAETGPGVCARIVACDVLDDLAHGVIGHHSTNSIRANGVRLLAALAEAGPECAAVLCSGVVVRAVASAMREEPEDTALHRWGTIVLRSVVAREEGVAVFVQETMA